MASSKFVCRVTPCLSTVNTECFKQVLGGTKPGTTSASQLFSCEQTFAIKGRSYSSRSMPGADTDLDVGPLPMGECCQCALVPTVLGWSQGMVHPHYKLAKGLFYNLESWSCCNCSLERGWKDACTHCYLNSHDISEWFLLTQLQLEV